MLPYTLPHDARLAVIDRKAFFQQDRGDMTGEPIDMLLERFIARESKIVCIAGVFRSNGSRESAQAAIDTVRAKIREHWRGRRTLRQMWPRIQNPRASQAIATNIESQILPNVGRGGVGADTAKKVSDYLGIAQEAKKCLDPGPAERRKEIP